MIEKILYDYLNSVLEVDAYLMRPANVGDTYVLMEKTGSETDNRITRANFAVQSYAPTLYGAATLNESVKQALENAVSLVEISSVDITSDYNFTDTRSKQPRYQCVVVITYYGGNS